MNSIPLVPINVLRVGDILCGQDNIKYIVKEKAGTLYWKPYVANDATSATTVSNPTKTTPIASPKPIKKVKEVKEKYYWKDNEKKPAYDGDKWTEMSKSLKPKVSPNKFPAGYVWTTKFRNISYVVDTGYKGYSKTSSRFWNDVCTCPPCLDANDYPFEYKSGDYYVDYDEQGNKFWCYKYGDDEYAPLQQAHKFVEGTTRTVGDGSTWVSIRRDDGSADWHFVPQDNSDCDSDDE